MSGMFRQCCVSSSNALRRCGKARAAFGASTSTTAKRHASASSSSRAPAVMEQTTEMPLSEPPFSALSPEELPSESITESTLVLQAERLAHLKTMVEMAEALHRHAFLQEDVQRQAELRRLIDEEGAKGGAGQWPIWVEQKYREMRKRQALTESSSDRRFRQGRSMLWTPSDMDETKFDALIDEYGEKLSAPMQDVWRTKDRQEQLDEVLKPYWDMLSKAEQEAGLVRVQYECARRLGWRKGYTSGYPVKRTEEERKETVKMLSTGSETEIRNKLASLDGEEEAQAWEAYQALSPAARKEETKMAWRLRDRSLIYIDDASSSSVHGLTHSRWLATPQRIGAMTFLPNDVIRLVRNTTTGSQSYDAFKATFRVPLNMHKHALRSYLLAIYGLRTTWCRSMIYRAPIVRDRLGQKRVGKSDRTFKKVEVGLLEPFVFPELSEAFIREHLLSEEINAAMTKLYFKLSRRRRWRSHRLPGRIPFDPHSASIEETTMSTRLEANKDAKHERKTNTKNAQLHQDQPDRLATMAGGIPTKRHSRILQMLTDKRRLRDALVAARSEELKDAQSTDR